MKKDKIVLIFPPQWTPISPHYALPSLIGQLKSNGYSAKAMDLNIDFYDKILTRQNLEDSFLLAKIQLEELKKEILKIYSPAKKENDYSLEEKIILYKYNYLKKYYANNEEKAKIIPSFIEAAKKTFKTDDFYNPVLLIKSLNIIDKGLEIVSLPYSPTRVQFDWIQNPFFKFNFESIKYFVNDTNSNIFIKYYETKIEEILKETPDLIAVSINSSSQIIAGLTLTSILKKRTDAHINIGGNFFGRITDELKKYPEFFNDFADSISIEEGEGPILKLAEYIASKIPIEQVSNLMYKKGNEIIQNPKMKPLKLDEVSNVNLDDYEFNKYFSPDIVLPFQSSRGCYWGKCSFCDQDFGQNFNIKNTDKTINEFKELKDKYNISKFEFIDESVSPVYLKELSEKLIKENVKISYFCDARLETAFESDILKSANESGLKMIMWGLESGSAKVMKLINKGIDLNKRFEILKNSNDANIWNFAFIFFGFPTETKEDAQKTVDMIIKYKDIIHSYGRSIFTMGRHAKLAQDPEKYGITKIYPAEEEFSPNINFECIGMNKSELKETLQYCIQECAKTYQNPLWMYLRYREWLFLYIDKYGKNYVSTYNLNLKEDK